jgi:hypothetical protein
VRPLTFKDGDSSQRSRERRLMMPSFLVNLRNTRYNVGFNDLHYSLDVKVVTHVSGELLTKYDMQSDSD